MYKYAYEITGYEFDNHTFTTMEFNIIKQNNPDITLDQAILIFEKAPANMTLEGFAKEKHRTASGYRGVYKKYFQ
tara:strand:- start:21 stop:245 length:225 start_codon:yes stop_codon:yes gene_type:complete